jgi:hypothetical protein
MATGHVGEQFFVPTGNIDIVTTSPSSTKGKVINHGSIMSDTAINVASSDFTNTGMISSRTSELAIKEKFQNTGYIDVSNNIELSAKFVDNRQQINANQIKIDSKSGFFNHLGGRILGNEVAIKSNYFINGARLQAVPTINVPSQLALQTDLTASANYGVFNSNNMTAVDAPLLDVSARIDAVKLSITAEKIENINPYFRLRKNERWDGQVSLNYEKSRQVSITAQNTIDLYANKYIVNSSAILGLNNNGDFTVNTPVFQNERYRVDTEGYIFSRKAQNSVEEKYYSLGKEIEAHLNAISPLPTFYSFGEFNFSPLTENASSVFTNLMGFMQIHGKSNFYNTAFASIAIMTSSQTEANIATECILNRCNMQNFQDNYTQTTFTSFLDDVYGLSSEVLVQTTVEVENYIQKSVDKYIAEYVQQQRDAFTARGGVIDVEGPSFGKMFYYDTRIDKPTYGDVLVIIIYTCRIIMDGEGYPDRMCVPDEHQRLVSDVVAEVAADGIIPGTEQTDAEIINTAKIYLANRNTAGEVMLTDRSNPYEPIEERVTGFWKGDFSRYQIDQNDNGQIDITISYLKYFYSDEALTDRVLNIDVDTAQMHTLTVPYASFKNTVPKTPVITSATYVGNTGKLTIDWSPVLVPNVSYEIQGSGLPSSFSNPTISSRLYTKRSSGQVQYKVRACSTLSSGKVCGAYSAIQTKQLTFTGSTPPGDGRPIIPPNCPGCQINNAPIGPGQGDHY